MRPKISWITITAWALSGHLGIGHEASHRALAVGNVDPFQMPRRSFQTILLGQRHSAPAADQYEHKYQQPNRSIDSA